MTATDQSGARFDFGRVTSRILGLVQKNFVPFFVMSLILAGAPYLVLTLIRPTPDVAQTNPGQFLTIILISVLVALFTSLLLQAALTRAAVDDLSGKGVSLGAALSTGVGFVLPLLGLAIVVGVAVAFGMLLLIVPGIYLALRWFVSTPVLVVEKAGVFKAMGRSAVLTQNHRWAILGLTVLFVIFALIVQIVVAVLIPGGMATYSGVAAEPSILFVVVMTVVQAVVSMIATVGVAAIYFELRQVKEGVDVTQLASVFE